MSTGDSKINVAINGDPKGLQRALKTADRSVGVTTKNLIGAGIALVGTKAVFDAIDDANTEADRLGDATARIELSLGKLGDPLKDTAGDFASIGQSAQDMLELEATFTDMATAAQIGAPDIATMADDVAATAAAVSLLGDQDAETVVENIGKAAGGSERPLKDLGISLTDAEVAARALADTGKTNAGTLTDQELATARVKIILEKLKPKLDEVTDGTQDLEGRQRELGARVETLSGQLGEKLAPAQEAVLGFIIDEIDAIPGAIEGWQKLGKVVVDVAGEILTPIARANDAVQTLLHALDQLSGHPGGPKGNFDPSDGGSSPTERNIIQGLTNYQSRNNLERAQGK